MERLAGVEQEEHFLLEFDGTWRKAFRVTTRFDSHYGNKQIHCFEDEIFQIRPHVLDRTGHEAVGEVCIEKEVTHARVISLRVVKHITGSFMILWWCIACYCKTNKIVVRKE